MPPCPMAIPSSTAMVLNSRGTAPAACTASATTCPTSRRCTWPGTNSVKLLATATIGLPISSRATPLARMSARAPAMFLPCVTVRDRSGGMCPAPLKGVEPSAYRRSGTARRVPRPRGPGPPPRRFTRSAGRGKHLRGGRVNPLDLIRAEACRGVAPRAMAQVFLQPAAGQHVDAADAGHGPRDGGSVDHQGGLHGDLLPECRAEQLASLVRRPERIGEPVRMAERAVIQPSALGGADGHPGVPALGVHGVDASRADDQMVDNALASWQDAGMQRAVADPAKPGQPPPGSPVRRGRPHAGGYGRSGPRAED